MIFLIWNQCWGNNKFYKKKCNLKIKKLKKKSKYFKEFLLLFVKEEIFLLDFFKVIKILNIKVITNMFADKKEVEKDKSKKINLRRLKF